MHEANRAMHPTAPELRVGGRPIIEGSYEIHSCCPTRRIIYPF
jgi:hypothetical protein